VAGVGINSSELSEVTTYLGSSYYDDADRVEAAYLAEKAAQAKKCRVPDYLMGEPDLFEALCRRVHRNLEMRNLPLGFQSTDMGAARPSLEDAEVRRLERPYLRTVVG